MSKSLKHRAREVIIALLITFAAIAALVSTVSQRDESTAINSLASAPRTHQP
jgi:hypothetical protein